MLPHTEHQQPLAINSTHPDTTTINKLNQTANETYLANPKSARKFAARALLEAKSIGYSKGICQSFLTIGITYWSQSYRSISLLYLDTALSYAKTDRLSRSDCYRYMARNYTDMKDYKQASTYLQKAKSEAGDDKLRTKKIISEISLLYFSQGEYNEALLYAYKALHINTDQNAAVANGIIYSRLADIYCSENQFEKALAYCDTSLKMSFTVNNKRLRASLLLTKAEILINQREMDDALRYAAQGQLLGDSLGVIDISARAYKTMIHAYDLLKDDKKALLYQKKYTAFLEKQALFDKENSSQLIRDYFDMNNQLGEINKVKHKQQENSVQIKQQQQLILTLLVSLAFVAVALYVVYFYYREKNMLAEQLQEQNVSITSQSQLIEAQSQHLEELNGFKTRLLAIIGHDLRAPIGNLSNIADMFTDEIITPVEVIGLMRTIAPIVKGAELTLSNLLVWAGGQLQGANSVQAVPVSILKVIKESEEIFKHQLDKKCIRLVQEFDVDCTVMADESHLKVIVNNLVSNAIKFTEMNGTITIAAEQVDNRVITSVTDTGIGMTETEAEGLQSAKRPVSKLGTSGEKGTGIGLRLCRELVELNGGTMWLKSEKSKGTIFYFSLAAC